jgi:hypothetical protein
MRHRTALASASVPLCVGLALATAPSYAGSHQGDRHGGHHGRATTYAFRGSGYGTKLIGGQVPAGSSTTGFQVIGCTNLAGRDRKNSVAAATLPGLGTASGVRTHVWTSSHDGVVASHSVHRIADLTLAQSQLGSLSVTGITSSATAYHRGTRFHATTATHVGGLTFTPTAGQPQTFPLPTPDQPVTIPGLATVYAGQHTTSHSETGALADAYALRVDVIPTGTSVRVAHSRAGLDSGLVGGVFRGHSAATRVVTAGGDLVRSGPQPLTPIPCQGTYGKTHEKSLASLDLGGQLVVRGATASEKGNQRDGRAWGTSRAAVARVALADQLVVDGIVGKVSVSRDGHQVTTSREGTRLGSVTVNGEQRRFPKTGVLEIPGVARLERDVVTRGHNGLSVIGLRITLLDGSGAVVDLAEASLRIRHLPS